MLKVPDGQSIAAMFWLSNLLGRKVGPSTGTNLVGMLHLAKQMQEAGESGSIVSLICDSGERYLNTYYDIDWQQAHIPIDFNYQQWLASLS